MYAVLMMRRSMDSQTKGGLELELLQRKSRSSWGA